MPSTSGPMYASAMPWLQHRAVLVVLTLAAARIAPASGFTSIGAPVEDFEAASVGRDQGRKDAPPDNGLILAAGSSRPPPPPPRPPGQTNVRDNENVPVRPGRIPGRHLSGPPDAPYWEPVFEIPWGGAPLQGPRPAPPQRPPGETAKPVTPPAPRPPRQQSSQPATQMTGTPQHNPRAEGAAAGLQAFTANNFRMNLGRRTGRIPEGAQAHHVFPVKFEEHFRMAGINVHDPRFGTWWETGAHQRRAHAYNEAWEVFFRNTPNPTPEQIVQFGRNLAGEYGLSIGF